MKVKLTQKKTGEFVVEQDYDYDNWPKGKPFQIDTMVNPKWTKVHAKYHSVFGASFCRRVSDETLNTVMEEVTDPKVVTCKDCQSSFKLMLELDEFDFGNKIKKLQ